MNSPVTITPLLSGHAVRPLLRLAQRISRAETAFVAGIDWDNRQRTVLASANSGQLQIVPGIELGDEGFHMPVSGWAMEEGIRTCLAFPILLGDEEVATLCCASRSALVSNPFELEALQLIAESIENLVAAGSETSGAVERADAAELDAFEAHDATRREALQYLHMKRLAHTDALTGLPNRRGFMTKWEDALARSRRRQHPIGLMLVDADRFKAVNDSAGHAMGDVVLRAIGATMLVVARAPEVVARLGGDEFALLSTNTRSNHLHELAAQIRHHFSGVASELGVDVTLSIGMASSEDCPRERLLADADLALYRCKVAGGNASTLSVCGDDLPDVAA
jgi:diguanylate cyclase